MEPITLKEIEEYSEAVGLKISTVCRKAINDGKFYTRIKAGGECLPSTSKRFKQYIADNPPGVK